MTIGPTNIGLSWTPPASGGLVGGYMVLQRVTGTSPFSIAAAGLSGTTYEVTGLIPSTSYDFAILATNGAGPGPMSNIITQATTGAIPNAPTGLTASAGTPAYSEVNLSWTAPTTDSTHGPATGYIVQQSPHGADTWTKVGTPSTTSYTATGLSHDTAYDFQVYAVDAQGGSATPSSTVTITTDYSPPNVPTISGVAPGTDGSATELWVTWSAPSTDSTHDAATGYDLQYSVHGANSWTVVSNLTSPYEITGLSASTEYDVQVRAKNASTTSPSAWSATTSASTYSYALGFGADGQGTSLPPTSPVSHTGSWPSGGLNFAVTNPLSHPSGMTGWFVYDTQNATPPSTGNGHAAACSAVWTSTYGVYVSPPPTAGTWYVWAELTTSTTAGSGSVTAAIVSSAITVT
jgi:hypothetical protein